jgi:hypothetical protein
MDMLIIFTMESTAIVSSIPTFQPILNLMFFHTFLQEIQI